MAKEFIKSLKGMQNEELASCALRALIVHSENTYFKPSFIENLTPSQRAKILQRFDDRNVNGVGNEKEDNALAMPVSIEISSKPVKVSSNVKR